MISASAQIAGTDWYDQEQGMEYAISPADVERMVDESGTIPLEAVQAWIEQSDDFRTVYNWCVEIKYGSKTYQYDERDRSP
jgi:hypothetical protein